MFETRKRKRERTRTRRPSCLALSGPDVTDEDHQERPGSAVHWKVLCELGSELKRTFQWSLLTSWGRSLKRLKSASLLTSVKQLCPGGPQGCAQQSAYLHLERTLHPEPATCQGLGWWMRFCFVVLVLCFLFKRDVMNTLRTCSCGRVRQFKRKNIQTTGSWRRPVI